MDYVSTRNKERKVSAAYAIANGIAPDGGLYCRPRFPRLPTRIGKRLRRAITRAARRLFSASS